MCFYIAHKLCKAFTVRFHVLCWKALRPLDGIVSGQSPHRNMFYDFGQQYTSPLGDSEFGTINVGLHSYSKQIRPWPGTRIYPALIPAGSKFYFSDTDEELVSESLVVFKNITDLKQATGVSEFRPAHYLPRSP